MNSKVLILNNDKENNFKAILSLKNRENCAIKFFNLKEKYKNLALGIKQDENIYKIPLKVEGDESNFCCENIDIEKNFTCAVVDVSNAFLPEMILSASGEDSFEIEKIENSFAKQKDPPSQLYSEDSDDEIEKIIDKNLEEDLSATYYDSCAKCKYRDAFYKEGEMVCPNSEQYEEEASNIIENQVSFLDDVPYIEDIEHKDSKRHSVETLSEEDKELSGEIEETEASFYSQISSQIDAIFRKYDKDDVLEGIISHSSWAKVTYDDKGNYYVLGLIYGEDGDTKYVSYGMPSKNKNIPPDDLAEYAEWVEVNAEEGYWIVSQDANSGKTIKQALI